MQPDKLSPGTLLFDTAIGPCGIAWSHRGIDRVQLPDRGRDATEARLLAFAPDRPAMTLATRRVPRTIRDAVRRMQRHLDGRLDDLADVPVDLAGASDFARRVWTKLRRVKPGSLATYGELARAAGRPNAARAVGRAMATNPVPLIVPCHRVLSSSRRFHGFSAPGGVLQKAWLLFIEGVEPDEAHARALAHVRAADPRIDALVAKVGPFAPTTHYLPNPYDALFEAVIYQQLSMKAAATIAGRVKALADGPGYPRPDALASIDDTRLRGAGLSRQKIGYLRDLAAHTARGDLPFRRFRSMPDEAVIDRITEVRGFGRWSAEMFLMFHLDRLDVLPMDDLGFRKGVQHVYGLRGEPDRAKMTRIAEPWRPYRSVGTWYMWRALEAEGA